MLIYITPFLRKTEQKKTHQNNISFHMVKKFCTLYILVVQMVTSDANISHEFNTEAKLPFTYKRQKYDP